MKRHVLVAFVVLSLAPGAASARMTGEGGGGGAAPPPAQQDAGPQMPVAGVSPGMMRQGMGMMPGMMGGGLMPAAMIGPELMGPMMSSMMDGMMPGRTRGCMMMAEGLMKGQVDLARMRKTLALSDEQAEKLRASLRPFQREAILNLASLKVAELELTDILAGAKVDFGKVEAKLKEIETLRTRIRLVHFKAAEAVKGILTKEQLDKLQAAEQSSARTAPATPASPQSGATPGGDAEHERRH